MFKEKWNFLHCVASIDGKHVRIKAPAHGGSAFFNYKTYHWVVILALVDGNKKCICVDVRQYGRASDGNVYSNSTIGKRITRLNMGIPPDEDLGGRSLPYVKVGDEAFPLQKFLMRPYPRSARRLNEDERIFNYRLSR